MTVDLGGSITSMVWDPRAAAAIAGTEDGRIYRVILDGRWSCVDAHHDGAVVTLAVDPILGLVASGDESGGVHLHAGRGQGTAVEMGSRVRSMAWSSVRRELAIISQVGGLVVVDEWGGRRFGAAPSRRLRAVAWHERNPIAPLLVGGAGGVTWIEPGSEEPVRRHDRAPGVVIALATDPVGPWIAFGDLRGETRLIDGRTGDETEVLGWPDAVDTFAWLPGRGEVVVVGGDEATVWLAGPDPDDAPQPPRHVLACQRITAVAPHPWRRLVALGGEASDGLRAPVTFWDVDAEVAELEVHVLGDVTSLVWDTMGEHVVAGTRCGRVNIIR